MAQEKKPLHTDPLRPVDVHSISYRIEDKSQRRLETVFSNDGPNRISGPDSLARYHANALPFDGTLFDYVIQNSTDAEQELLFAIIKATIEKHLQKIADGKLTFQGDTGSLRVFCNYLARQRETISFDFTKREFLAQTPPRRLSLELPNFIDLAQSLADGDNFRRLPDHDQLRHIILDKGMAKALLIMCYRGLEPSEIFRVFDSTLPRNKDFLDQLRLRLGPKVKIPTMARRSHYWTDNDARVFSSMVDALTKKVGIDRYVNLDIGKYDETLGMLVAANWIDRNAITTDPDFAPRRTVRSMTTVVTYELASHAAEVARLAKGKPSRIPISTRIINAYSVLDSSSSHPLKARIK